LSTSARLDESCYARLDGVDVVAAELVSNVTTEVIDRKKYGDIVTTVGTPVKEPTFGT
jgi:hypothetical protein